MSTERERCVGLLAIGDELLAGAHPDLNSPWLAARVAEHGRRVARVVTVGDDEQAIAAAIADLARRAALVVTSGGLGPTPDDLTRHGAARAAGVELGHSEEAWGQIRRWYQRAGREMPATNERQALIPAGATVLENTTGTAPGFRASVGDAALFVLPGPPREMQAMAEQSLLPWLADRPLDGTVRRVRALHMFDLPESTFAQDAGAWLARDANPLIGVTVKQGILSAKLVAEADSAAEAEELLATRGAELRERFGAHVFSEDTPDLALVLGAELVRGGATVTVAESCTGGLVAAALTRAPGISAVFREGFVTYSNEAKTRQLGVGEALLTEHGAVSPPVAEAMARGAAERADVRLAVATTGIAGPGGGSEAKPVGLVWFGLARGTESVAVRRRWPDAGRDRIRTWATAKALALLLQAARGAPLAGLATEPKRPAPRS